MRNTIGAGLLIIALICLLANHYFVIEDSQANVLSFTTAIIFVTGIFLILPNFIFDPLEWEKNKKLEDIVYKFRLRGVLFNNIAVAIFMMILAVILTGFYLLINPFPRMTSEQVKQLTDPSSALTIRISSSVLLIFLVGILFRVFKYLIRVAAFYNSKADALEFYKANPDSKIELEKLMEIFTPEKYDISDLDQSSIASNIIDMFKSKSVH